MSQPELVKRIADSFASAGIEYMLTGSVASSLQGEPRSTHDIDIVVKAEVKDIPRLRACFPDDAFYVSEEALKEAVRQKRMFNVIELREHDKVDVWLLKDEPFERSRFLRRVTANAFGASFKVSAPEDTILYKLHWLRQLGQSEKQFNDALRVYEVQQGVLDQQYLDKWAVQLGVDALLKGIRAKADQSGIQ